MYKTTVLRSLRHEKEELDERIERLQHEREIIEKEIERLTKDDPRGNEKSSYHYSEMLHGKDHYSN